MSRDEATRYGMSAYIIEQSPGPSVMIGQNKVTIFIAPTAFALVQGSFPKGIARPIRRSLSRTDLLKIFRLADIKKQDKKSA